MVRMVSPVSQKLKSESVSSKQSGACASEFDGDNGRLVPLREQFSTLFFLEQFFCCCEEEERLFRHLFTHLLLVCHLQHW